jgi:hypothetical protein
MWETFSDFAGLLVGTALVTSLLLPSGAAIAAFAGRFGMKEFERPDWGVALLSSVAIMPALLSVTARLASVDTAVAVQLLLALLGIATIRKMERPPLSMVCGLLACAVVVGIELGDFRWDQKLYHATFATDMVKHAATVNSILSWGLPLTDPFVNRPQPAGYYYFFYTVAAVPVRLTMGLVDARAAVGALAAIDGAALLALAALLWRKCKLGPPVSTKIVELLILLLLCGNLDIIASLPFAFVSHVWPIQIEWWNEQILPWTLSLLWVPHHIMALIAGMFGLLLITEGPGAAVAILGGIAFASCVGASLWVGLGIAFTALIWLVSLVIRHQYRLALTLAAAGCLAGLFLVPQIFDLLHGRSYAGSPIALTVREFYTLDGLVAPGFIRDGLRLMLLPVNYFSEFGILAIGAVFFWRDHRSATKTEAARVLVFAAAAGLLLGTFTRSTAINNDLGWRVMLLPQLAFLIWTTAVIVAGGKQFRMREWLRWPGAMGIVLVIGYADTCYALISARIYPFLAPDVVLVPPVAQNPDVDDALAAAYTWANTHVSRDAVFQHNPVSDRRVVDFGLYGRNRVAVADRDATLYGASSADVSARVAAIGPIFTTPLSAAEVRSRAFAYGIDVLVVSSADPVWADHRDWVWSRPVLFSSPRVRLIATRALEPGG